MTSKTNIAKGAEDVTEHLEAAAENAGRYARKVWEKTADGSETLTTAIREEPVKAVCVALVLGFLVGAVIRR